METVETPLDPPLPTPHPPIPVPMMIVEATPTDHLLQIAQLKRLIAMPPPPPPPPPPPRPKFLHSMGRVETSSLKWTHCYNKDLKWVLVVEASFLNEVQIFPRVQYVVHNLRSIACIALATVRWHYVSRNKCDLRVLGTVTALSTMECTLLISHH